MVPAGKGRSTHGIGLEIDSTVSRLRARRPTAGPSGRRSPSVVAITGMDFFSVAGDSFEAEVEGMVVG